MNLIRFLSSGSRGLTKGAPPMGRYRLPDGRLIPNFGGGKNPFTSKALPLQEESSPADGVPARAALTQAVPPSPVTSFPPKEQPSLGPRRLGVKVATSALLARAKSSGRKLLTSIRGLPSALIARLPRRQRQVSLPTSSNPQPKGPVQTELSLEKVRVVRNDLTDTDYEVVCAETATASPVTRVPRTVSVSTDPRPLGRLAERLFSHPKR